MILGLLDTSPYYKISKQKPKNSNLTSLECPEKEEKVELRKEDTKEEEEEEKNYMKKRLKEA